MFSKLKNIFKKKPVKPEAVKKETVSKKTPKQLATEAGRPWVDIISVEVDPENINAGSFELDFNDKFVINLIKAGYRQRDDDTDQDIVDRWFQTVCRNVALEMYEQQQADPVNREMEQMLQIKSRNLGNGRREVS